MNQDVANAVSRYVQTLYDMNQKCLLLCGADLYNGPDYIIPKVFEFHGEKCCLIDKEDNSDIRFILKTIKKYEGNFTSWFGDNVRYSLCQCPHCGAYFLHEETEHISWSDGNDYFTDLFYQVESPQHAEKLMQESLIHIHYEGPRVFVRD